MLPNLVAELRAPGTPTCAPFLGLSVPKALHGFCLAVASDQALGIRRCSGIGGSCALHFEHPCRGLRHLLALLLRRVEHPCQGLRHLLALLLGRIEPPCQDLRRLLFVHPEEIFGTCSTSTLLEPYATCFRTEFYFTDKTFGIWSKPQSSVKHLDQGAHQASNLDIDTHTLCFGRSNFQQNCDQIVATGGNAPSGWHSTSRVPQGCSTWMAAWAT